MSGESRDVLKSGTTWRRQAVYRRILIRNFEQRHYAEALSAAENVSDEALSKEAETLPLKYMFIGIARKLLGHEDDLPFYFWWNRRTSPLSSTEQANVDFFC